MQAAHTQVAGYADLLRIHVVTFSVQICHGFVLQFPLNVVLFPLGAVFCSCEAFIP